MAWRTRPFPLIGLVLLAACVLTGCAERQTVRARTVPTGGSDASFSNASRLSWTSDTEVYELVRHPPAVAEAEHRRRLCQPTGPTFPPRLMVGLGEHREERGINEPMPLAAIDPIPMVDGPDRHDPRRIMALEYMPDDADEDRLGVRPIASFAWQQRPLPVTRTPTRLASSEVGKMACCNE
jgi:hypothetical protein